MAVVAIQGKKLRRLPHVFSKVLELPFKSEADVSIEEHPDFFRFIADAKNFASSSWDDKLTAHTVELHPGINKVVVRSGERSSSGKLRCASLLIDELELDVWRFRLPAAAQAEAAKAVCGGGKLVVTVPKSAGATTGSGSGSGGGGQCYTGRVRGNIEITVL